MAVCHNDTVVGARPKMLDKSDLADKESINNSYILYSPHANTKDYILCYLFIWIIIWKS